MRYLIGCDARWINKLAPAFPTPALRKEREERGTHSIGDARQIKAWATRPATVRYNAVDCNEE